MTETLYRRPLPPDTIAFASPEGRAVFAEALATGGLDGYFRLAEQFHTQADPSFCGLGSLVVALNALAIDPGRLWKGPWRWFAEDLLDCCVPLEEVRRRGLDLDELACLARCNGADVELERAALASFRQALATSARGEAVLVVAYDRSALGQTGTGHFSPIGGYHPGRDLALVLDVARFKYPPHWIAVDRLWQATLPVDPASGRSRGWMLLRARPAGIALGYTLRCEGHDLKAFALRFLAIVDELGAGPVDPLALALAPLTANLELREPTSADHQAAVATTHAALRELPVFERVRAAVGAERAEAVMILLGAAAAWRAVAPTSELGALLAAVRRDDVLARELEHLHAQLDALSHVLRRDQPA